MTLPRPCPSTPVRSEGSTRIVGTGRLRRGRPYSPQDPKPLHAGRVVEQSSQMATSVDDAIIALQFPPPCPRDRPSGVAFASALVAAIVFLGTLGLGVRSTSAATAPASHPV